MKIGRYDFDVAHHTYVMGILNVTPDSFSDGGRYNTMEQALAHAQQMVREGAHILDIGGESTRPGHVPISEEEEIQRTASVVERLRREFDLPLSIDTHKAAVAAAAIEAGADLVNDVWGLKYDPGMAALIAEKEVACCLMHNRANDSYGNFMEEVLTELADTLTLAEQAGIQRERIMLDPGVGFGKNYWQNLEILDSLEKLHALGCPLLLGASRKSVVGLTLDLPVDQRLEGTLVTTVYAVQKGYAFVRVHDVKEHVRAIRMTEAIRDGWR